MGEGEAPGGGGGGGHLEDKNRKPEVVERVSGGGEGC